MKWWNTHTSEVYLTIRIFYGMVVKYHSLFILTPTCRGSSSFAKNCNTSPNPSTTGYNISGGIRSATRSTRAATATKAFYCFTYRNTGWIPRKRNTIYVVVNVYYHDQKEPYVVSLCRLKKLKIKFILLVVQHTVVHKYVSSHAATKNYIYKPLCNF